MSQAIIGKGTTIGWSATNSGFTPFVEVTDVKPPKQKGKDVDATHYTSPNAYEEYIPGWANAGEVSVEAHYLKAQQGVIGPIFMVMQWFQIAIPDTSGSTWTFQGYINAWDGTLPNNDKAMTNFTIKITGKPVFVAGS